MKHPFAIACFIMCLSVVFTAQGVAAERSTLSMTPVSPKSVGMSPERLARIEGAWKREIADKSFPGGITLIARDGKIVYFQAVGHMDAKQTKPMPKDAVVLLASLTKPVVSVATMMLVEQGRLKLNDPIGKHLKEFSGVDMKVEVVKTDAEGKKISEFVPAKRAITIQDLLRHTAFPAPATATPTVKKLYAENNIMASSGPISGDEMLKRLAQIPLSDQPGTTFHYGIATNVLGLLLERVVGKNLDLVLKEMVLHPLKMQDTTFILSPAQKSRRPEFFASEPNLARILKAEELNGDSRTYLRGNGGLYSTMPDYYRFAAMLLNGGELDGVRLLSPKTIEIMTADHLEGMGPAAYNLGSNNGPGYGFGLGFAVRICKGVSWFPGTVGDYNWGGSRGHYLFIDPKERLIGIFMSYGSAARAHTRQVFKNLTYAAIEKAK